jgi:hypothetical protein
MGRRPYATTSWGPVVHHSKIRRRLAAMDTARVIRAICRPRSIRDNVGTTPKADERRDPIARDGSTGDSPIGLPARWPTARRRKAGQFSDWCGIYSPACAQRLISAHSPRIREPRTVPRRDRGSVDIAASRRGIDGRHRSVLLIASNSQMEITLKHKNPNGAPRMRPGITHSMSFQAETQETTANSVA